MGKFLRKKSHMSRGKFNSKRTKHLRILIFGDFMASRSSMTFPETMFNLLGWIVHRRAAGIHGTRVMIKKALVNQSLRK
jgi:hypothetical protein